MSKIVSRTDHNVQTNLINYIVIGGAADYATRIVVM